eukprot:jgi/Mesvir1/20385/Mv12290-RA.1
MSEICWPASKWQRTLAAPQYDRGCGALQSVSISFVGEVTGSAAVENWLANPASRVTLNNAAQIVVSRSPVAGGGTLFVANPKQSQVANLGAYDGIMDFGGSSGATFSGLSAIVSNSTTLTAIDMDEFVSATAGTVGQVFFPTTAVAASQTSGDGIVITSYRTLAAATISVRYKFTSSQPPPPPV